MIKRQLLTPSELNQFYFIPKIDDKRLTAIIEDTQFFELKKLINCDEYFNKILIKPDDFKDLLNQGTYQYKEKDFFNIGLKKVLATLVYGNLMHELNDTLTPYGNKEKNAPESQPIPKSERWSVKQEYYKKAVSFWEDVKGFLITVNYQGYNDICKCEETKPENLIFELKNIKASYD